MLENFNYCLILTLTHSISLLFEFIINREDEPGWDTEIKDDVIEECNKHGGVVHIYVDKSSPQVSSCTCIVFSLDYLFCFRPLMQIMSAFLLNHVRENTLTV